MTVLICYRTRRRLDAYLDGALDAPETGVIAAHLTTCQRCAAEADALRRVGSLLRAMPSPVDPDWAGFWPGIVRGIQDARRPAVGRPALPWLRWTYGSVLAAALLMALTIWPFAPGLLVREIPVIVQSANTEHPDATVMVYSTAERDLTVVWVLGLH